MSEYYGEWDTIRGLEVQLAALTAERDRYREALEKFEPWMLDLVDEQADLLEGFGAAEGEWLRIASAIRHALNRKKGDEK